MSFAWPVMLWLLALLPMGGLLYLYALRQRRQFAERAGSLGLLRGAAGAQPGWRAHAAPLLFGLALTVLIFSLARPQAPVSLPRVEGTVVLAFDVSASMSADDIEPNRMEVARAAALDFVERQPTAMQVGVVAFSNGGIAAQSPTNDQEALLQAIGRLRPQSGTSLGHGVAAAINLIAADSADGPAPTPDPETLAPLPDIPGQDELLQRFPSAVIVLLSDGENNDGPDPLEAAQAAADRGVRIFTVGVGTTEGTVVQLDGFSVHSSLYETTLMDMAELSGGAYYNAQNEEDLAAIYDEVSARLVVRSQEMELTALLAGAGIVLLVLGAMLSLAWYGRAP